MTSPATPQGFFGRARPARGPAPLIDPFRGRSLPARLGHRPLRFPLRLLHVRGHAFLPKRELLTLEELDRLCSAFVARGVQQAADHRRRAAGAHATSWTCSAPVAAPRFRRARGADADHQRQPARALRRRARRAAACAGSTSRSTRSTPTSSAPSPAGATSPRCSTASTPRGRPGCRSRSTPWRCGASTTTRSTTMIAWAHGRGMDLTLIEVMPMGEIGIDRIDQYLPLSASCAQRLETPLHADADIRRPHRRPGALRPRRARPAGVLGFITPLTHNFCESCNRVRLTCTGQLYMCLGQEDGRPARASARLAGRCACWRAAWSRRSRASPRATTSSSSASARPRCRGT